MIKTNEQTEENGMDIRFDHVAVNVESISASVEWYRSTIGATVLYQDETWAFLEAGGVRIALTLSRQHPAHIAFDIGPNPSAEFLKKAKTHRDGSTSQYLVDPDGNAIELIHFPENALESVRHGRTGNEMGNSAR
jgi:catechol-2,3-dioxygenase